MKLAEIKEFKQDKNTILRFLILNTDFEKFKEDDNAVWRRITGGKKNIALKLYYILLNSKKGEFSEDLSKKIKEPIHNIRRSLNDLDKIGLVEKLKRKRNRVLSDFWRIKEKINGFLRLLPLEGLTSNVIGEEKFWFEKFKELSDDFIKYTGYNWITKKSINWKIEKNGLMNYNENRKFQKLSEITPPVSYITLFAKSDDYNLNISNKDGKPIDINTEIYEHSNKKLNIVNALIPKDVFRNEFKKLHIGEVYNLVISDKKRLYACPKLKNSYMACFIYQINSENIDSLNIKYQIHKNLSPTSCGIWFDNHKEFEINLTMTDIHDQEYVKWYVNEIKNYIEFSWEGKYLLNKAHIVKFLFEFQPLYESDIKQWIKLYEAIDCPFCQKIPFETIRRL